MENEKKKKVHFFYYYYYFKQCTYILINQNSVTQKFEFEKLVLNIFLVPITFQKVYNKKKNVFMKIIYCVQSFVEFIANQTTEVDVFRLLSFNPMHLCAYA